MNLPLKAISHSLNLDLGAQAACVSMMVVGGAIGALGCASVSDRLGRRAALLATSAPILAGTIMCSWAGDALTFYTGRFLCGIGVGAASAVAPALVAELSPPSSRGLASVLTRVAMVLGILVSYIAAEVLRQVRLHLHALPRYWYFNPRGPKTTLKVAFNEAQQCPSLLA
jgi:MFS family permease